MTHILGHPRLGTFVRAFLEKPHSPITYKYIFKRKQGQQGKRKAGKEVMLRVSDLWWGAVREKDLAHSECQIIIGFLPLKFLFVEFTWNSMLASKISYQQWGLLGRGHLFGASCRAKLLCSIIYTQVWGCTEPWPREG